MKRKNGSILQPLSILLILLILWISACHLKIWTDYLLPSPIKVLHSFWKMILTGELFLDIAISLRRVLIGFCIAFIFASLLGVLSSLKPTWSGYYHFLVQFMRNVPPLSLVALLILWYGIGETSKIIIIILASFFPMFLNISKGFSQCDQKLLDVGISLGLTKKELFFRIILPNALSDILVGMRIGLGYSWRAIIGAEMIAASTGLGHMILYAQQMSRSDKVIVGILMIGSVGYACDRIFAYLIRKILKGESKNVWT